MHRRAKVAILVDTATSWGSGIIEGIAEYAHIQENWLFYLEPRGKYDRLSLPDGWDGDGVIARITHPELATQIVERQIPAVNVSWYRHGEGSIPRCTCDEIATAELAARYFIDRGYRQFAYCGSSLRPDYVDRFGDAFAKRLAEAGFGCSLFLPKCGQGKPLSWSEQIEGLRDWLVHLPKPVALLSYDDLQGRQVTEACELAELDVPHEVAVLGGEEDQLSSRISRPPLSSIDQSPRQVGFEAAALLSRLMNRQATPDQAILIPPNRIVTRQSTDTMAVENHLVASAVQFIQEHYQRHIQVSDVLEAVPGSRRTLEKSFRRHLGRTPAEEIRRVRVEHAVQLLCDTQWSMSQIATASGFEHPELLSRAFRRELKISPTEFRKRQHAQAVAGNS